MTEKWTLATKWMDGCRMSTDPLGLSNKWLADGGGGLPGPVYLSISLSEIKTRDDSPLLLLLLLYLVDRKLRLSVCLFE